MKMTRVDWTSNRMGQQKGHFLLSEGVSAKLLCLGIYFLICRLFNCILVLAL